MRNLNHVELSGKAVHYLCYFQFMQIMAEGLDDISEGVNIGVELVRDVKFADDQRMTAETEVGLQKNNGQFK